MVKAYTQEHVYKHPWDRVTSASWRKFTDQVNARTLSHILEVDTLNRRLDPQTGRLYTTQSSRFLQNGIKGREVMERIYKYLKAESSGISI